VDGRGDIGGPTNVNDDNFDSQQEWKSGIEKSFITDNEGTWTTCRLMLFAAIILCEESRRKYSNLYYSVLLPRRARVLTGDTESSNSAVDFAMERRHV
jgi:hypothetical protein